jgi:hypothetical protein
MMAADDGRIKAGLVRLDCVWFRAGGRGFAPMRGRVRGPDPDRAPENLRKRDPPRPGETDSAIANFMVRRRGGFLLKKPKKPWPPPSG